MNTKTKAQRTPGPWTIQHIGGSEKSPYAANIEATPIGDVPVAQWVYNDTDARLIAAAPDLLEIATILLLDHQRIEPHHHDLCDICRLACAAISKAEGK